VVVGHDSRQSAALKLFGNCGCQLRRQLLVPGHDGKRPRDIGQVDRLIRAYGTHQRDVCFGYNLLRQMRSRAVGATDDHPHAALKDEFGELRDARLPRIVRPGRDESERLALEATAAFASLTASCAAHHISPDTGSSGSLGAK